MRVAYLWIVAVDVSLSPPAYGEPGVHEHVERRLCVCVCLSELARESLLMLTRSSSRQVTTRRHRPDVRQLPRAALLLPAARPANAPCRPNWPPETCSQVSLQGPVCTRWWASVFVCDCSRRGRGRDRDTMRAQSGIEQDPLVSCLADEHAPTRKARRRVETGSERWGRMRRRRSPIQRAALQPSQQRMDAAAIQCCTRSQQGHLIARYLRAEHESAPIESTSMSTSSVGRPRHR